MQMYNAVTGDAREIDNRALPPAPEHALPLLKSLTRVEPSPLLQWQLLDIMYAYVYLMRLYNGDYTTDVQASLTS